MRMVCSFRAWQGFGAKAYYSIFCRGPTTTSDKGRQGKAKGPKLAWPRSCAAARCPILQTAPTAPTARRQSSIGRSRLKMTSQHTRRALQSHRACQNPHTGMFSRASQRFCYMMSAIRHHLSWSDLTCVGHSESCQFGQSGWRPRARRVQTETANHRHGSAVAARIGIRPGFGAGFSTGHQVSGVRE